MSVRPRILALSGLVLSSVMMAACSGDDSVSPPASYTVGGSVTGLQGGSLRLQNNGADELSLATDGAFRFSEPLPAGSSFSISIVSQPSGMICQVANGSGTVAQSDVSNVSVQCQPASYSVGGVVSGLEGGELILQNNGGDDLSVTANGPFVFATDLISGTSYTVAVVSQPPGQLCEVSAGSGVVAAGDVTSVSVGCEAELFTIGGTVTGLSGGTLILGNNGGDDLDLTADGNFTFGTAVQDGSPYDVSVIAQPSGQLCTVSGGSGSVSGADVTDVLATCLDAYSVGGTVTGLTSTPVLIQNNGGDDLSISANGAFTFPAILADGSGYDVGVAAQPDGQTCVVIDGIGTISGTDVSDVQIACDARALSNKIVFHSDRDGDFEIYRMRPDGSNVVQLTDNDVDDFWPAVSPDGTTIAFWTGRDGNQEIYVMAADGSGPTRVTSNGAADRQPAWSPDGQRIAFHRESGGTTEIYTIGVDGTGEIRLTNNAFDDEEPAWSPDGTLIAFMTNRDGNNEVYVMNASDGSNPQNLSQNPGRDGKPDWSPDGSMLLFDRNNTSVDPAWLGDAEVMCMNSDGSGQVRLTTDTWGAVDTQPRWSANGARLAFNSDRVSAGDPDVFVGQANGCAGITQLNRITDSTGKDAAADWSPQ